MSQQLVSLSKRFHFNKVSSLKSQVSRVIEAAIKSRAMTKAVGPNGKEMELVETDPTDAEFLFG